MAKSVEPILITAKEAREVVVQVCTALGFTAAGHSAPQKVEVSGDDENISVSAETEIVKRTLSVGADAQIRLEQTFGFAHCVVTSVLNPDRTVAQSKQSIDKSTGELGHSVSCEIGEPGTRFLQRRLTSIARQLFPIARPLLGVTPCAPSGGEKVSANNDDPKPVDVKAIIRNIGPLFPPQSLG